MVGTGIFTSLGFQVGGLPSGFAIMALWAAGGICALCGALAYAELGAALPRSGGEYHFLREIYHPAVGFLAGWISATVGFAAPVAIAAIAFSTYFAEVVPGANQLFLSIAVVTICTVVLLRDLKLGSAFQNGSTILKVALILVIVAAGFYVKSTQPISFLPAKGDGALIVSAPFAIGLYWVMYAYSGWNASTYIVGELRNPSRAIPLSVGLGTLLVMVLYLATNAAFLRTTPMGEMDSKPQVALIAGEHIFGTAGGKVVALFICRTHFHRQRDDVDRAAHHGRDGRRSRRVPLARAPKLAGNSDHGDRHTVCHRYPAIADCIFPNCGEPRPIQPHSLLYPHGVGCVRAALAAARSAASLSHLGVSDHAAHFSRDQLLDVGTSPGRQLHARTVAQRPCDHGRGADHLLSLSENRARGRSS